MLLLIIRICTHTLQLNISMNNKSQRNLFNTPRIKYTRPVNNKDFFVIYGNPSKNILVKPPRLYTERLYCEYIYYHTNTVHKLRPGAAVTRWQETCAQNPPVVYLFTACIYMDIKQGSLYKINLGMGMCLNRLFYQDVEGLVHDINRLQELHKRKQKQTLGTFPVGVYFNTLCPDE